MVYVTLRAYRRGECANPDPSASNTSCSNNYYHECVASEFCLWKQDTSSQVSSISQCLWRDDDTVWGYSDASRLGHFWLFWPELFSQQPRLEHQVLIQFQKVGYHTTSSLFNVPVGGIKDIGIIYMAPITGTDDALSTFAPAMDPTPVPSFMPTNIVVPSSLTTAPSFHPTGSPVTNSPTISPVTKSPTLVGETFAPSINPTSSPVTNGPTNSPVTRSPTLVGATFAPSINPTSSPVTNGPTDSPVTRSPTLIGATFAPSINPTGSPVTNSPTDSPVTRSPTLVGETFAPSINPTDLPGTNIPTDSPVTRSPTLVGETFAPSINPTGSPGTHTPTNVGGSFSPSIMPTRSPSLRSLEPTPSSSEWSTVDLENIDIACRICEKAQVAPNGNDWRSTSYFQCPCNELNHDSASATFIYKWNEWQPLNCIYEFDFECEVENDGEIGNFDPDVIVHFEINVTDGQNITVKDVVDDIKNSLENTTDNLDSFNFDVSILTWEFFSLPFVEGDTTNAACLVRCNQLCTRDCRITLVNQTANCSLFESFVNRTVDPQWGISPAVDLSFFVSQVGNHLEMNPSESCSSEVKSETTIEVDITPSANSTDDDINGINDHLGTNNTNTSLGETNIDKCGRNSCSNRGTCKDGSCECQFGSNGYQCQNIVHTCHTGNWIKAFEQRSCNEVLLDVGNVTFQNLFSSSGLIRYERYGAPYAYYYRENNRDDFNAYKSMLSDWSNGNNETLGEEFEIYSSELDLDLRKDSWAFCMYAEPESGIGFPFNCGPHGPRVFSWCSGFCQTQYGSFKISATQRFALYICDNENSVSNEASNNETGNFDSIAGTLSGTVESNYGNGVSSIVRLYRRVLLEVVNDTSFVAEVQTVLLDTFIAVVSNSSVNNLPVDSDSCGSSTNGETSQRSEFTFVDIPEGIYSLVVFPENAQLYSPMVMNNVYFNATGIALYVDSVPDKDEIQIKLVHDGSSKLELRMNFQVDSNSSEECVIGISSLSDGVCSCGDAQVRLLSADVETATQIIAISNMYNTVYNVFLSHTPQSSVFSYPRYHSSGRCGAYFPLEDGSKSECPTQEILWDDGTFNRRPCCSQDGYCGSTERHCECANCLDFRVFESSEWKDQYRRDGLCRDPLNPASNGEIPYCPVRAVTWWDDSNEIKPCCSASFQCSSSISDCTCATCVDFRTVNLQNNATRGPTLEESNAVVSVYSRDGLLTVVTMPPPQPANYDGFQELASSNFVRLFCIDGQDKIIHEYPAPRYFRFEGKMLALNDCGPAPSCGYVSVNGMQYNPNLNGLYAKQLPPLLRYNSYPGYDISPVCSIGRIMGHVEQCMDTCYSNITCDGFVFSEGSCRLFKKNCGGGRFSSRNTSYIVYEKRSSDQQMSGWYEKIETKLNASKIYLYRGVSDPLLGGAFTWYFDNNLNSNDGFMSKGVDVSGLPGPDGVVQWLTEVTYWSYKLFLVEAPLQASASSVEGNCDMQLPSIAKDLLTMTCNCDASIQITNYSDPTSLRACVDIISVCPTFELKIQGMCFARTRWSTRPVQCEAKHYSQQWSISKAGVLFGRGVTSNIVEYQNHVYTVGVGFSGVLKVGGDDVAGFNGDKNNALWTSMDDIPACISKSISLGQNISLTTDTLNCASIHL